MKNQQIVRELLAVFAALFFSSIILHGCGGVSVRERDVYEAEISFIEAASEEQSMRGIELIAEQCECDEDGFTTQECRDLAETILVVQTRMPYHIGFMRFLGGISEERPEKDPPEVPDSSALCVSVSGVKIGDLDDYPSIDAGVDGGE